MLKKLKQLNNKGFTIIEVLIVLAIAGLIMLIVFLAVPALQRNSRNNQRKEDAAKLLAAVSEFTNNNNGKLPSTALTVPTVGTVQFNGAAGDTISQSKVGYFNKGITAATAGHVGQIIAPAALAVRSTSVSQDWLTLQYGATCNADGTASVGSTRSIVAQVQIETGANTYGTSCIDS